MRRSNRWRSICRESTDPLLHDLRSELPDPFKVSGERRHDFDRADYVRRKRDRTAAVLKGSASGSGIPWSSYCWKTNIGCIFQGKKDGKEKKYYLYNICDHQECYKEVGSQAISYTTGVPAMIGAMLVMNGTWQKPGVYNIEEFDPDPFMDALNKWGLPWKESWDPALVD